MSVRTWVARHAQTLVGSLGRLLQQPVATFMTMAVIGIALALPLLLNVALQNASTGTANWNQTFDISVYMAKKALPTRTQALAKQLRSRPDVEAVRVITATDALREFRDASGFGSALDALNDNPLPDTLVVTPALTASTADGMESLRSFLVALADVDTVQVDSGWVNRLHAMMLIVRRVIELIGALLGVGVVLVVGNTIRLDILNRRSEIEVMKLVGATDGFARRPFLYSGLWYGMGGGALALVIVALAVTLLAGPVHRLAGLYHSEFQLRGMGLGYCCAALGVSMGLGWLGSWLAATRHIRAIEPT